MLNKKNDKSFVVLYLLIGKSLQSFNTLCHIKLTR